MENDPTKFQIPDPKDCTKFYKCLKDQKGNWVAEKFTCPLTTGFNAEERFCDFLSNLPFCNEGPQDCNGVKPVKVGEKNSKYIHIILSNLPKIKKLRLRPSLSLLNSYKFWTK